jgi:type I restriction enzyme S subunit
LGDVVKLISNVVKVQPDAEYKMAGVRWYGEGVFHRETVRGDSTSSQYLAPLIPGALIYNRLFAWKASFAVVLISDNYFSPPTTIRIPHLKDA